MTQRAYAPHADFIAPARASAAFWRVVVGFLVASVLYILLSRFYFQVIFTLSGDNAYAFYDTLLNGQTPLAMFLLLSSFIFMIAGVDGALRLLHQRPLQSTLGPRSVFMPQFVAVMKVLLLVGAVIFILPPWDVGQDYIANMPLGRWLMLLPLSLLAVLVQVSAEEIVFRGYLQQQLAARFKSPLIWMVVPSILFATGHYMPEEAGDNAWLIAAWAGIFGMLMADLTARAGSLAPAIAVHFVNNITAIVITSMPDSLSGLALYLMPFSMADEAMLRDWLPVDFAIMLVAWLAARLAIRR